LFSIDFFLPTLLTFESFFVNSASRCNNLVEHAMTPLTLDQAKAILNDCRNGKTDKVVKLITFLDVDDELHAKLGTSRAEVRSFLRGNIALQRKIDFRACKMGDLSRADELFHTLTEGYYRAESLGSSYEEIRGFAHLLLSDLVDQARTNPIKLGGVIDFIDDNSFTHKELGTTKTEFARLKAEYDLVNRRSRNKYSPK